ncbi:MAG: cellulase family glycosylhydrolase [Anaerolineae bacterium]
MPHFFKLTKWGSLLALLMCLIIGGTQAQEAAPAVEITLPTYQGWISVAPDGRYFVDETGQGFVVIGENDAISWPGLNTLFEGTGPQATERYVEDLRAHGVTVSRIMMEYAQQVDSFMENPVGTFNDQVVAFWDAFIPMAEANGLYLLLTLYDTFWQSEYWDIYPYNGDAGGPCATRRDWLTGRACIDAQKNRWRFIIDRWGGSPSIFAWDLMNEIDIHWNATADEIGAYIDEMAQFVRDTQMERWGHTSLITVSSAAPQPDGSLGRLIYNSPSLDFATTHLYIGSIRAPNDPIFPGVTMGGGVLLSLQQIRDRRPYFDSESGPIDDWIARTDFDQEYHNNMSWAHLASCGAGTGMRWPYTNPHFILPELRQNLLAIARFASTIDWAQFRSENITQRVMVSDRRVLKAGCSDGQTAILWLLADRRNPANTVEIPGTVVTINQGFEAGNYRVQYWDTYTGDVLAEEVVSVQEGVFEFTVPDLGLALRSLAIAIHAD